jgi:hypothetical protein
MAMLIDRVMRGEVLHISPVLIRDENFDRAEATLEFNNDADVPMIARGTIPADGALRAEPAEFEVTLGPKATKAITIELRADRPLAVSKPSAGFHPLALAVNWTATYSPPDRPPLRVPREDVLGADRAWPCSARTAPVIVDGKLDEWAELPLECVPPKSAPAPAPAKAPDSAPDATAAPGPAPAPAPAPQWAGPQDCSFRFAVAHDEKFLYIAAKTTDDRAVLNPKKEPWSQDGIEVRFDARPQAQRAQSRGHGEFKDILVISMSPGQTPGQMVLYEAQQLPPGVRAVCVKTPTGHSAEIAIPASYLDQKQGGPWSGFRLNIAVDDFDAPAGPLKALWWRPDWRYADTFAGSGSFERR